MAPTCTTDNQPLVFHCGSHQCEWWTCPTCQATYDVQRGIRILRDGQVESTSD